MSHLRQVVASVDNYLEKNTQNYTKNPNKETNKEYENPNKTRIIRWT